MPNLKVVSIVDDDESIRNSTQSLVRSMGWQARAYASADQFLAALALDGAPCLDCIVSDIQMPGTNGLQLLQKLREGHYTFTIIFVTGFFSEDIAQTAMSEGALCVLEKPVDPTLLCDWLCLALSREAR